jgi:hypothetical protein
MAESARAKAHISGGEAYPYHGFHVGDGCGFAGTNRHSLEETLLRQIHVNPVVVSRDDVNNWRSTQPILKKGHIPMTISKSISGRR